MDPTTLYQPPTSLLPTLLDPLAPVSTQGSAAAPGRRRAFRRALLAIPAAVGIGWALRSRRAGMVAGGLATLALGALRWQMSRWFCESPAYITDAQIGVLELRTYPRAIEARAELEARSFEEAIDLGFARLACYAFGANAAYEDIEMLTPVIASVSDGVYAMTIAMPPGRTLGSLPAPDDPRVVLREAPERRYAVLGFSGRFSRENVGAQERRLLRHVLGLGLAARARVGVAMYDSPATLPFLRRNEVMIEIQ